jgi:hypothetical protein
MMPTSPHAHMDTFPSRVFLVPNARARFSAQLNLLTFFVPTHLNTNKISGRGCRPSRHVVTLAENHISAGQSLPNDRETRLWRLGTVAFSTYIAAGCAGGLTARETSTGPTGMCHPPGITICCVGFCLLLPQFIILDTRRRG